MTNFQSSSKILYLASGVYDKGGIARYSRYQIRALRELCGHRRVRALSLLGPDEHALEEPFAMFYRGGTAGRSYREKLRFVQRSARSALTMRPDIIWCNHLHLLPLALWLRRLQPRAKVAVNVYGMELWGDRQEQNRRYLQQADLVVSDCHCSADYVLDFYRVQEQRLRVLWDCVDIERFAPRPRREDVLASFGVPTGPEYRYVMTLGRIDVPSRYKGYDRLLDALKKLRDQPQIIALFVGDGDDRTRLEQRARDEGLSGRAFFLGRVSEDLLNDVYNLCDVFTLVSERGHAQGEGIPLTPLEAAACAKPLVVGDEDGSREAVIEAQNGYIVSPRDANAQFAALKKLLLDDELRAQMGAAARARIENEFGYEGFRDKTAQCLREMSARALRN